MNKFLQSFRKYSVLLPYLVSLISILVYIGQHLINLNLIPPDYHFIITAILAPISAHLGRLIPQPNLPDSAYVKSK